MAKFKNIVGTGLLDYVQTQISKREEIVNKQNRTPSDLQWLSNRTGWFRLSSGVNTQNEEGYSAKDAQLNVLQGGSIAAGGDKTALRRGFNETYTQGETDQLGYKPMPGITGIRIGSMGKWQTLMEAEINFVCYDLDQLDLMTKLYMSLGTTLFLEWGHTPYIDNSGTLQKNIRPINFFPFSDEDRLIQEINKRRQDTFGNYDAIVGKVLNFNWKPNNDGSYNCTTRILGAGGIVESLRINRSSNVDFDPGKNIESKKFSSVLGNVLWTMHNYLSTREDLFKTVKEGKVYSNTGPDLGTTPTINNKFGKISPDSFFYDPNFKEEKFISWGKLLKHVYSQASYNKISFEEGDSFSAEVKYVNSDTTDPISNPSTFGNAYQLITGIGKDNDGLNPIPTDFYSGYVNQLKTDNENNQIGTYITLGHLMALIQHIGIFTQTNEGINLANGSFDTSTCKPIMYIDYHPENTEVLTGPLECSIDPTKCIIPWVSKVSQNEFFAPLSVEGASAYKWWGGLDKLGNTFKNFNNFPDKNKINGIAPEYGGKIFNILINIKFAYQSLDDLANKSQDFSVNLIEYINIILNEINNSLGQVNNLRAFIGEDGKVLRIIDETVTQEIPKENYITIPNFGLKSTVYDYGFSTAIKPETMAQIVISTQANFEGGLKEFSDKSLSFASLNYDVEDRFSRVKLPAVPPLNSVDLDDSDGFNFKTLQKLYDHIYYCYSLDGDTNLGLKINEINNLITVFSDLQGTNEKTLKKVNGNPNGGTILLPLEYNLTLDGISGLLPYNAFLLPNNRLPKKYRNRVAFAIFSINHNLDDNKWTTTLRGLTLLLDKPVQISTKKTTKPTGEPVSPPTGTSIDTDFPEVERTPPTVSIGNTDVPDNSFTPNELPDAPTGQPVTLQPQTQPIPDQDITAIVNFIKPLEGFRETPYPDPDWERIRIGYGSDTITNPDGSFYKITRKSRVDKPTAELDLIRRVTDEFKPRVVSRLNSRGVSYDSLPLKLKVVFVDLAYNYGTLFFDFIEGYKSDGVQGVIDELQRRANIGGTQVPSRRNAEIRYLGG